MSSQTSELTDSKPYLEYLDKEMTIMGVLSAFAVAVPGLVISQVAGAGDKSLLRDVWTGYHLWILIGSLALMFSALMFYRQRSLLAYYYGQICLTLSPYRGTESTRYWLREADSWATWLHYRWAFGCLMFGFIEYGVAFSTFPSSMLGRHLGWTVYMPAIAVIGVCSIQSIILRGLKFSKDPWAVVRRFMRIKVRRFMRTKKTGFL